MNREPIYSALFSLLSAVPGITSATRVVRDFDTLSMEQYPALFLEEKTETAHVKIPGVPPTYTLLVDIAVFVKENSGAEAIGSETNIPSANLNNLLDAIETALKAPLSTFIQTLGLAGVQHLYVEGPIAKYPAVPGKGSSVSIGVIPVVILAV
jgi:hypothetical protein